MKNRLLKVAKYLSSHGMYEEAAQIKKIAGYEEDRAAGWHPYDDWHEPRYQKPPPIQTSEALKAIYDAQTRSEAQRIAAGVRESMEMQWAQDRAELAKMERAIRDIPDLPDDAIESLALDGKKKNLARLNRKASFRRNAQMASRVEGVDFDAVQAACESLIGRKIKVSGGTFVGDRMEITLVDRPRIQDVPRFDGKGQTIAFFNWSSGSGKNGLLQLLVPNANEIDKGTPATAVDVSPGKSGGFSGPVAWADIGGKNLWLAAHGGATDLTGDMTMQFSTRD